MKKIALLLVMLLVATTAAWAQGPANDVGIAAQSSLHLVGPGTTAIGGVSCPPAGVISSAFTGATSQLGRIFRDAIPSTCPSKVYPGLFNAATTYNYETYTYSNTSGATACVTVNFDPDTVGASPCATNAHASAYLGSYNPASQATNYVGDVGSSLAQPFSFDVPAATDMVLVVTNTSAQAICTYGFEILNLPCTTIVEAELALSKTVAPTSVAPGDNAIFTLTVTNNGPGDAANTVVTDTLPAGLTYVSNDCGAAFASPTLTWSVGTLLNATSATCNVTVTVDQAGSFTNNASATSDGTDAVPANNGDTAVVTGNINTLEVPTLSTAGFLALLVGLGAAAIFMLRRRS